MSHRRLLLGLTLLASPAWAQYPGHPVTSPGITAADLASRDRAIADDAFQGRGPGTQAGEAAASWIADEMRRIGLTPGNHGSYFQDVPSVSITLNASASHLSFATPHGALTPAFPADVVYWTPQFRADTVAVHDTPLVFVGYGVVAPEYHWDDYAGIDVRGKTVVLLINDPGNQDASPDPAFFKGRAMTYYGRWTYKYEEAARHGGGRGDDRARDRTRRLRAGRWCATPTPAPNPGWTTPTATCRHACRCRAGSRWTSRTRPLRPRRARLR